MRKLATVAALIALGMPCLARAGEDTPSDLAFLEVGKAYVIKFVPGADPFEVKESQVIPVTATSTPADGSGPATTSTIPTTMHMTYRVNEFVVRKLGRGSWALLEHPSDVKAATETLGARRALEDKETVAQQEKTEDGRKLLASWREDAKREVKVARTWINLAHAVTIAPPDAEPKAPKINVEIKEKGRD